MPIPARSRAALIVAEQTIHHDAPPETVLATKAAQVRMAKDDEYGA